MGKTIEQIRTGRTRRLLRARKLVFRCGPDPLITVPARGFWKCRILSIRHAQGVLSTPMRSALTSALAVSKSLRI
ncbi:hypothetical protein, partial [Roseovarius sp. D22-M7]|uniref:hypothetical protein n=1 Tax=Roseovarius sp. D22-M7 TaxID=3127116 RepID=UPI00300F98FA